MEDVILLTRGVYASALYRIRSGTGAAEVGPEASAIGPDTHHGVKDHVALTVVDWFSHV